MATTYVSVNGTFKGETTVKEFRAPTDESVKLLRDLKEQSVNEILASAHLTSDIIQGVGVYVQAGFDSMGAFKTSDSVMHSIMGETILYLRFIINNKEYTAKEKLTREEIFELKRDTMSKYSHQLFIEKLVNVYSRVIAVELLKKSEDLLKSFY